MFGMTCMKYVQKHVWEVHLCALQVVLSCARLRLVCTYALLLASIDGTRE